MKRMVNVKLVAIKLFSRGSVDPNTSVSIKSLFFSVRLPTRGAPLMEIAIA